MIKVQTEPESRTSKKYPENLRETDIVVSLGVHGELWVLCYEDRGYIFREIGALRWGSCGYTDTIEAQIYRHEEYSLGIYVMESPKELANWVFKHKKT